MKVSFVEFIFCSVKVVVENKAGIQTWPNQAVLFNRSHWVSGLCLIPGDVVARLQPVVVAGSC